MLIPYIKPDMLKNQPDQTCKILNDLILAVNRLQKEK